MKKSKFAIFVRHAALLLMLASTCVYCAPNGAEKTGGEPAAAAVASASDNERYNTSAAPDWDNWDGEESGDSDGAKNQPQNDTVTEERAAAGSRLPAVIAILAAVNCALIVFGLSVLLLAWRKLERALCAEGKETPSENGGDGGKNNNGILEEISTLRNDIISNFETRLGELKKLVVPKPSKESADNKPADDLRSNIKKGFDTVNESVVDLTKKVEDLKEKELDRIGKREEDVSQREEKANQRKSKLDEREREVDSLKNEVENKKAEIVRNAEERTRKESEQTIADWKNKYEEKNRKFDEVSTALSNSEKENGRLKNDVSALQVEKSKYEASAQELENMKSECAKQQQYIQKLNGDISERDVRVTGLRADVEEKRREIETLQGMIYPSEFADDADFAILKEHLYGWLRTKTAGAELAASALEMFAQRVAVNAVLENDVSWELALRNIALGVSQAVYANDKSAGAVIKELVLWSKFLMKFSDENFDFYLEIPNVGDNFDISRMSAKKSKNISKVSRVITWGVYHNQFGIRHNAEVE